MFELQPIYPTGIGLLDVEVIVVVVDLVKHLDPERLTVPVCAKVNAGHSQVIDLAPVRNEQLVDLDQSRLHITHFSRPQKNGLPKCSVAQPIHLWH